MKNLYTILDKKAQTHSEPFTTENDETATRLFSNTVNAPRDRDSSISQYPGDFDLLHIGYYDLEQGTIDANARPRYLVNGLDVKIKSSNENK